VKLTARNTAGLKLPAGKIDHIEFDDSIPGFGLRIREGGSRTWIYQYSLGKKQRRVVIGKGTAIKPDKARELAADLHAKVRLGGDPAAERAVSKAEAANSFSLLADRYLDFQKDNLRPRSLVEVRRHLLIYAKALHGLPVGTIDRRTIADRLTAIAKDSGAVTANRLRASLSATFSWGMKQGLASSNPVIDTNKQKEKSRERVLTNKELQAIWLALEDDDYGAIIKLLTLTGQRANEIAGLRWFEVLEDMIDLPGERTKNGKPHFVPLSRPAREILNALPHRKNADGKPRELVFGWGEGPFSGWSKAKDQLDERLRKAGHKLPHWVPHDLRRTVVTKMAGEPLKVLPHVLEMIINHVSGHKAGVAGIYNKETYLSERRQALALWGEQLLAIVEGRESNITPFKRA
jgi:integrase